MTSCSQPCPQLLWGSLQLLTVRAEELHAKRRCSTRATREHSRLHASVLKSISKNKIEHRLLQGRRFRTFRCGKQRRYEKTQEWQE
jgi:hypothetical protein